MLSVLGLSNLTLMGNKNNTESSPILNTCTSTTLEIQSFLLVELREERYIVLEYSKYEEYNFAISFVDIYSQIWVKLYPLPRIQLHCVISSTIVVRIRRQFFFLANVKFSFVTF